MYYHLLCLQNHNMIASGSNSRTKKELKEGLLSYLSGDFNAPLRKLKKMKVEEICEMYEFEIVKTKKKITINY